MLIKRVNTSAFAVTATLLLLLVVGMQARSGPPTSAPAALKGAKLAALIDAVGAHGPASQLPPHLSVTLGISSKDQPTPVKQAVMRAGNWVRTFNVSNNRPDDVVLMVFDTATRHTQAYLTNAHAKLRSAVSYQAGEAPNERSLVEARGDFDIEIAYWTGLSHPGAAQR